MLTATVIPGFQTFATSFTPFTKRVPTLSFDTRLPVSDRLMSSWRAFQRAGDSCRAHGRWAGRRVSEAQPEAYGTERGKIAEGVMRVRVCVCVCVHMRGG